MAASKFVACLVGWGVNAYLPIDGFFSQVRTRGGGVESGRRQDGRRQHVRKGVTGLPVQVFNIAALHGVLGY